MKQPRGEELAESVGRLWAETRRDMLIMGKPDVVVPVPLHWRRQWERGYNQSEALARGLATGLGLPLCTGAIRRVRPTPKQTLQTPTSRWENVKGAFQPRRAAGVTKKTILLVDDVMTTGATANAAATALLAGGAAQVHVAVLAHR